MRSFPTCATRMCEGDWECPKSLAPCELCDDGSANGSTKERIRSDLEQMLKNSRLESVSYGENLTSMYFSFSGLNGTNLDGLHSTLNKIAPVQKLNVFFNAPGAWG